MTDNQKIAGNRKENAVMTELKTAKYLKSLDSVPQEHHPGMAGPKTRLDMEKEIGGLGIRMRWQYFTKSGDIELEHHQHPFDQSLIFLGGNPEKMLELNAEIKIVLSEDGVNRETHVITSATCVTIPRGLYHCPLIIKRIDEPFIFIEMYSGDSYTRK